MDYRIIELNDSVRAFKEELPPNGTERMKEMMNVIISNYEAINTITFDTNPKIRSAELKLLKSVDSVIKKYQTGVDMSVNTFLYGLSNWWK